MKGTEHMTSEDRLPAVNRELWDSYKYRNNVPLQGLPGNPKPIISGYENWLG